MYRQLSHYNHGRLPLAFIFSAPGAKEVDQEAPISGVTGDNLSMALVRLVQRAPIIFESIHRNDYRITNAHSAPLARSRGDRRTEAAKSEILNPDNLARVMKEIGGCKRVVLCGNKAQLLATSIRQAGYQVIEVSHTSTQALVAKHNSPSAKQGKTPTDRRKMRALAWADDLLLKL